MLLVWKIISQVKTFLMLPPFWSQMSLRQLTNYAITISLKSVENIVSMCVVITVLKSAIVPGLFRYTCHAYNRMDLNHGGQMIPCSCVKLLIHLGLCCTNYTPQK